MHTEGSKAAFNGSADSDQGDIAFAEYRELATHTKTHVVATDKSLRHATRELCKEDPRF